MEKDEHLANRYQNQNWFVKRWRDRHLIGIPWEAIRIYWYNGPHNKDEDDPLSFSNSWSIACGLCDSKREYWYSWDEMIGKLGWTEEDLKDDDNESNLS